MRREFYRRRLPHWQFSDATYFITYRLAGSVPMEVIKMIRADYEAALESIQMEGFSRDVPLDKNDNDLKESQLEQKTKHFKAKKQLYNAWNDFLDLNLNEPYWLKQDDIAEVNMNAIKFYDGKRYQLLACTIMSNHIHLVFHLLPGAPELSKVLQDLKRYTALQSNRKLGRSGPFWEQESYDHIVRANEFERIMAYVLNNPVKAGLVNKWTDWKWTYCHESYRFI